MLARKLTESNEKKAVLTGDLQKITWVQTVSPSGLSQRERNTFYVLLAALRLCPGATRIKSSIGNLSGVHRRAGLPGSPATVRRALAGLEGKGYLWRRRCRLGSSRLGLELLIARDRWAYWTQTKTGSVTPITAPKPPTSAYIPPRQSMGAGEDRTITRSFVNTCNININSSYARADNALYNFLSRHPVMLTLWCLLKGSPDMILFNRAKREVQAIESNQTPEEPITGIPWEDIERHWDDMIPEVRDSYAKSQILPKLRGESSEPSMEAPLRDLSDNPSTTDEDRNEIKQLIEKSIESVGPTVTPPPLSQPLAPAENNMTLSDEELRILQPARDNVKRRFVDS